MKDTSKKCGAKTRNGGRCEKSAGWGTLHVGQGKCKLHGGATPVKHGLRSRYDHINRPRIKALLQAFEADDDPRNLQPEVNLLRALILDYVERYDEHTEGLLAWHASFNPAFTAHYALWQGAHERWHEAYKEWREKWRQYREEVEKVQQFYKQGWPEPPALDAFPFPPEPPEPASFAAKPREVPDILSVGKFVVAIGTLVDRIHRQEQEGSITLDTLRAVLQQFGVELYNGLNEALPEPSDESVRSAILEAVESRWGRIDLPKPENLRNRRELGDHGTEDGATAG
jgi:hypothetical protein